MIVTKKRLGGSMILVLGVVTLGMFFLASVGGLITERPVGDKLMFLPFLIVSALGLRACWKAFEKLVSASPVFELTDGALLIYDNPEYNRIELKYMVDCNVYYPKHGVILGISVKAEAPYADNTNRMQRWYFSIPKGNTKMIFVSAELADTDLKEFAGLIRQRAISTSNK